MNHMIPAVGLGVSTNDSANSESLPPLTEYNKLDDSEQKRYDDPKRPVFDPLWTGLKTQGLIKDPERGPATTSARRESPSQVFGFISPRGNNYHIDDDPENEFVRIRTRSGVQIIIHETTGYIYMNSKDGNSWFEISDVGIDMYSKRSISMRGEENINMHADGSILINGAGAIHRMSSNETHRSSGWMSEKADGEIKRNSPLIRENTSNGGKKKSTGKITSKMKEIADYIRQQSPKHKGKYFPNGVPPDFAVGVAKTEGLKASTIDSSTFSNPDSGGTSYGPYQLYDKSSTPGTLYGGGLAADFYKQTGEVPSASNWQQQVDYSLQYMADKGYSDWHGVKNNGGFDNVSLIGKTSGM